MGDQLNTATEKYLSRFYEPKITAYEFLKCFFACLKKNGHQDIKRDIVSFLYTQKKEIKNSDVLEEIDFRSNGVSYYSDEVEDALFNLQNGGLLGKMNPSFGIIFLKYTDEEAIEVIEQTPETYRPVIEEIANNFTQN